MLSTRTFPEDYKQLPKKTIGACGLLYYHNDILIIQPTYHQEWTLPGGLIDVDESPLDGLNRELKEILNIQLRSPHLMAVDYVSHHDALGDYIQFLFGAQGLTIHQVQAMQASAYDINDFRFVDPQRAVELLNPFSRKRVLSTLKSFEHQEGSLYLENGGLLYDPFKALIAER